MAKNRISEAEWRVMNVLWIRPGSTANEVIDALSKEEWSARTIRTLISRLVAKKVLTVDREGAEHKFSPAVDEADCIRNETNSLLRRIRAGATQPMLAAFIEEQQLSKAEIQELRDILDRKLKGTDQEGGTA